MTAELAPVLAIAAYLLGSWLVVRFAPRGASTTPRSASDPGATAGAEALRAELQRGLASEGPSFRAGGWEVVVRRDVAVRRVELLVPGAVGSFEARVPSAGDMLDAFDGTSTSGVLLDGLLQVAGDATLQGGAVSHLGTLVNAPGVLRARLAASTLVVETTWDTPEELLPVVELSLAVARLLERRPLQVRVRGALVQGLAWTGGAAARCPYCHDGLEGELTTCEGCRTIHHADCLADGGCAVLGCRGRRAQARA